MSNIKDYQEVNFNSDILNDEGHIYFPTEHNMFTLFSFPATSETLPYVLSFGRKRIMEKNGTIPKMVFIPFMMYSNYAFTCKPEKSITNICLNLGLAYKVLIPDYLKYRINGVI